MKSKKLVKQALIAAIYTALSLGLAPLSFGAVQLRISEALTILPIFNPSYIIGVTLGCFLTNLLGFFMGVNILGSLDIFFGTGATLIAAVLTYYLRNVKFKGLPVLSTIPPIIVNAIVVGGELTFLIANGFNLAVFSLQALLVGAGQFGSCLILGLLLYKLIEKNPKLKEIISN